MAYHHSPEGHRPEAGKHVQHMLDTRAYAGTTAEGNTLVVGVRTFRGSRDNAVELGPHEDTHNYVSYASTPRLARVGGDRADVYDVVLGKAGSIEHFMIAGLATNEARVVSAALYKLEPNGYRIPAPPDGYIKVYRREQPGIADPAGQATHLMQPGMMTPEQRQEFLAPSKIDAAIARYRDTQHTQAA